ncbi:hypothetical protein MTR67_048334 [Solanum verrucosum]|uniref:Integrase catalytic domain-containing protein n=1 Tax=Solanum verrucosum TaxID=315347 RepID=A0AAF0ZZX8_SOLVR|nr:hypothetical protein MTR67_048334 [Solanum verrucosum]
MQILRSCRCNLRSPSTDRKSDHSLCWWSVVHHCNPSPNHLRKLAKTRLTDRPTVRRSDHDLWSVSVERDFPYLPLTQTTIDQHRPSFDPRSVGLIVDEAHNQRVEVFSQGGDGVLLYQGRLCVPDVGELRQHILAEAHNSRYSIHPGATKMYRDLREVYWWNGMKRDIADFVAKCPNCQQVKVEHQKPGGMTQEIDIPTWKWEVIKMDFITGLPRTRRHHDSIWVIVDRVTKSSRFLAVKTTDSTEDYAKIYINDIVRLHGVPFSIISDRGPQFTSHFWKSFQKGLGTQVNLSTTFHPQTDGEAALIGPDSVLDAMEKVQLIRDRLMTAQSRQKSYADVRRRELEFQVDDWVFLKVSPMKGVMRFGKKGKLSPRYVGPYRILKKVGKVAYELELPADLAAVHPVFHISLLKKCVGDTASIVPLESVAVKDSLSYEDVPIEILDRQVRRLRNKKVASVKVLWRSQSVEGATWEAEATMKSKYPHLFPSDCILA